MIRLLCSIVFAWHMGASAQNMLRFGTYVGIVENKTLGLKQLLKLELVAARQDGNDIRLRSIMTLQFGGFESGEYVSYHFHQVNFNLLTGVLTFNQTDQEAYLINAVIKNSTLTADLYSSSGYVGPVRMVLSPPNPRISPDNLIEPLGGEYRGSCGRTPAVLQLFTYRNTEDTFRPGNQFSAYAVRGQLGRFDPVYCSSAKAEYCVYSKVDSAAYDFHRGKLTLTGNPFSYDCKVKGGEIDCGDCAFKRVSEEMKEPKGAPLAPFIDPVDALRKRLSRVPAAAIAGEYSGYVFHEHLNRFQKISFEVSTYQKMVDGASALFISANARITFGDSTTETISYRYDPLPFPNPLLSRRFVLARPEADVDAMVLVTDVREGLIEGVWYSLLFGKVGSFVATKNGDLPALPRAQIVQPLSGSYSELDKPADMRIDLVASQRGAPIGSDNPFYPINIMGSVWRKSGIVQKASITTGSYDFYTGRVGLTYGDGKMIAGWVNERPVTLRRLAGGFGTFVQDFKAKRYDVQQIENEVPAL